jgi:hypothetical protein
MPTPLQDKNEIKVFILFLLDRIGYPLDYETIGSIVVQDGVVRYFDFADSFYELLDAGHIEKASADGTQLRLGGAEEPSALYSVTDSGREVARALGESLMTSVREQGIRSAVRHLSLQKLGASIDQTYEPEGDRFLYRCLIRDASGEMMRVELRVDDRRTLDRILRNYAERPEVIYRGVLALLSGDINYIFE